MNLPAPRTAISFVMLLAATLVSSYLLSSHEGKDDHSSKPELGLVYYLDDAVLKGTGKDGQLLFRIRADRAARSNEDNYIDLTKVKLDYGPPTSLPWVVSAFRGRITPRGKFIQLRGNVVATSESANSDTIVLRTSTLNVESDTLIARTNSDVILQLGDRAIEATGMEANFETNDLKLMSNVHGRFLP